MPAGPPAVLREIVLPLPSLYRLAAPLATRATVGVLCHGKCPSSDIGIITLVASQLRSTLPHSNKGIL